MKELLNILVMVSSVLSLPVFSTRAAAKLQSRTWVWNKYFALLDTSTFRHHRQLWAGLQGRGAWRGGRTASHLWIIHYTEALPYPCVLTQVLLKGQMSIKDFGGKGFFIKREMWLRKTERVFGDLVMGGVRKQKTAIVPFGTMFCLGFQATYRTIRLWKNIPHETWELPLFLFCIKVLKSL